MVSIIFRVKAKDGKADEAEAALAKMTAAVEANESKTIAYIFHRSQEDPGEFVLFENYPDDATLQEHMQTPHMKELQGIFGDLFDASTIKAERLDRLAGFARSAA